MSKLMVDIETYSDESIAKSGAYRYAASPSFEILLFAYSYNDSPVKVIDLASGEDLPEWLKLALHSDDCRKYAYNAAFEFCCLNQVYGGLQPRQWYCSMIHSLYAGYPGSLEAAGAALGLAEDKRKLTTGKALIRYFCQPCRPTKANGGRIRNLPQHAPDKWEQFKTYCQQDVITEMEIEKRLASRPVPDDVWQQWHTDLTINARGVAVDTKMVMGALDISERTRKQLMEEATQITGLENPNSVEQLRKWLNQETDGEEIEDLTKKTVQTALNQDGNSAEVKRILEIRQELGKTSTKKYDALINCVCPDGKVRGLLQFYGANRSGRWAGRLVQVQNLPRTYLQGLDMARQLVRDGNAEALRVIYGSIPDTLSQLIRTVFTASPGQILIDADFSAIEARVLSWLAGENWRLDVFRTHGKIYEASAAQMFNVPLEKITKGNPEYALRQKGKIAELALGYGGGAGALKTMGALEMGLKEEELPDIVSRWRNANRRIVKFWYQLDKAATEVVTAGGKKIIHGLILSLEYSRQLGGALVIQLPSGRKLYYIKPIIVTNRFGSQSIAYTGVNQVTRKWQQIETYGGKLCENVTQAIARDCLAVAIERLEAAGYPVVFHVHDECVIDIAADRDPNAMLADVVRIMAEPIPWAKGLPLDADGWTGNYFRKD